MNRVTWRRWHHWAIGAIALLVVVAWPPRSSPDRLTDALADYPALVPTTASATTTSSTPATSTTVAALPVATVPADTSTSSTSTTTTTLALPVPITPPDPRADEPLVQLGRIEIARLGLDLPLYSGITLGTLDQGPGHWPGTALPGQLGNVVVAGHRVSHGGPFRNIDQLQPGDEVVLTGPDGRFVYLVVDNEIVTPDAMRIIDQSAAYTATLFACHPPGSTRERIVVHLELQAVGA